MAELTICNSCDIKKGEKMANTSPHPYVPSAGIIVQTFTQFRKAMPAKVDAAVLKKLALAPSNESMVLGALRFLGFIDAEGNRTESGKHVFLQHDDAKFASTLEKHVKQGYVALFDVRGDDAWTLDRDNLIGFFRANDETSGITAQRQAVTFETLAALSGHGEISKPRPSQGGRKAAGTGSNAKAAAGKLTDPVSKVHVKPKDEIKPLTNGGDVALTVRIEVNLPAQGDQETYDRIFKSIRSNLLNG
jgi:hypothetical protein